MIHVFTWLQHYICDCFNGASHLQAEQLNATARSILLAWRVNVVHLVIQPAGSKLPVNYQLCQQVKHNKDLIAFAFGIPSPSRDGNCYFNCKIEQLLSGLSPGKESRM